MLWMRFDNEGRVLEVIDANVAAGFYPLPRPDINAGDLLTDDDFVALGVDRPVAIAPDRHITQLAFINRFSDSEAIAIDLASQGATVQAAAMRRYQAKVNAASYIDLDRPDTRAGVQALEAAGLLAPGRALTILDAEVQEQELYRG